MDQSVGSFDYVLQTGAQIIKQKNDILPAMRIHQSIHVRIVHLSNIDVKSNGNKDDGNGSSKDEGVN